MSHHCAKFIAGKNHQYKRYIKMCEKALEIQNNHHITVGDCVYNEREGVIEAKIIRGGIIISTPDRAINCPISDCTWLPTQEDLIKMAKEINLTPASLQIFLTDSSGTSTYRPSPDAYFRMPEEQWLAYYMFERNEKWLTRDEEWEQIKSNTEHV